MGRRPDKETPDSVGPQTPDQERREKAMSAVEKLKNAARELFQLFTPPQEEPGEAAETDSLPSPVPIESNSGQNLLNGLLANFTEKDAQGHSRLVIPMPSEKTLEKIVTKVGEILGEFLK